MISGKKQLLRQFNTCNHDTNKKDSLNPGRRSVGSMGSLISPQRSQYEELSSIKKNQLKQTTPASPQTMDKRKRTSYVSELNEVRKELKVRKNLSSKKSKTSSKKEK